MLLVTTKSDGTLLLSGVYMGKKKCFQKIKHDVLLWQPPAWFLFVSAKQTTWGKAVNALSLVVRRVRTEITTKTKKRIPKWAPMCVCHG